MNGPLRGGRVFLSASFPSGDRGQRFRPYDAGEIADAVTALTRAVFTAGGGLVFGGHPTITPLVLFVAGEYHLHQAVDVFQSRWFEREIPAETRRFEEAGFGRIIWTERRSTQEESLRLMRERMLKETDPLGGVFIGGMEGILQEWAFFGELLADRPRIPFGAPGGAATQLVDLAGALPAVVTTQLSSPRYPVIAHEIIEYLCTL